MEQKQANTSSQSQDDPDNVKLPDVPDAKRLKKILKTRLQLMKRQKELAEREVGSDYEEEERFLNEEIKVNQVLCDIEKKLIKYGLIDLDDECKAMLKGGSLLNVVITETGNELLNQKLTSALADKCRNSARDIGIFLDSKTVENICTSVREEQLSKGVLNPLPAKGEKEFYDLVQKVACIITKAVKEARLAKAATMFDDYVSQEELRQIEADLAAGPCPSASNPMPLAAIFATIQQEGETEQMNGVVNLEEGDGDIIGLSDDDDENDVNGDKEDNSSAADDRDILLTCDGDSDSSASVMNEKGFDAEPATLGEILAGDSPKSTSLNTAKNAASFPQLEHNSEQVVDEDMDTLHSLPAQSPMQISPNQGDPTGEGSAKEDECSRSREECLASEGILLAEEFDQEKHQSDLTTREDVSSESIQEAAKRADGSTEYDEVQKAQFKPEWLKGETSNDLAKSFAEHPCNRFLADEDDGIECVFEKVNPPLMEDHQNEQLVWEWMKQNNEVKSMPVEVIELSDDDADMNTDQPRPSSNDLLRSLMNGDNDDDIEVIEESTKNESRQVHEEPPAKMMKCDHP